MSAGINKYLLEIEKELPSSSMKDCVNETKTKWNLVLGNIAAVKADIQCTVDNHISNLNQRRQQLLNEIEPYEKAVRQKVDGFEDVLTSEQFTVNARAQLKANSELETLQRRSSRLNSLLRNLQDELKEETIFYRFNLCPECPKSLGRIGYIQSVPTFIPYQNKIHVIGSGIEACGETYHDMAICKRSDNVYIAGPGFVREYRSEDQTSVMKFPTAIQNPSIAINSKGQLILANKDANEIMIVDKSGKEINKFSAKRGGAQGELDEPMGVACDADDKIYVGDSKNSRISIFDPNLKFLRNVAKGVVDKPSSLAFTQKGDMVVSDSKEQKVFMFDARFRLLRGFGDDRTSVMLVEPRGLHVDEDGFILVGSNGAEPRVHVYTDDGKHHATLCDPNKQTSGTAAVTINQQGHILVLDHVTNNVSIF